MNILNSIFASSAVRKITQSTDLMLAFFILSAIAVLILPMPFMLLDVLIAINFTISISLVMLSLYIPAAVHISAFPSILLISTLFRLSINVAASRLILLKAFAGNIIAAFGAFVVGGNFVVGIVTFILITVVQFIVIVKGTERVAEVAARFALDSLPGQQMAIEADMRAGLLDSKQATEKRRALEIESQLYGSLDGALKFVKGDSIAGLIITVVNILGGVAVGVLMHHMTAVKALKTYILLTVGQGLVSQIPAFVVSFTAGIITTRVTSGGGNLGAELSTQLTQQPRALILAGITIFGLSLIPGFPWFTLIPIALMLGFGGYYLQSKKTHKSGAGATEAAAEATMQNIQTDGESTIEGGEQQFGNTIPVMLELGAVISTELKNQKTNVLVMEDMIPKMRSAIYNDMGVNCPGVHVKTNSKHLTEHSYRILLNEVPTMHGEIIPNHLLVNENNTTLQQYNISYKEIANRDGMPTCWVPETASPILQQLNIKYWTTIQTVILHLSIFYKKYASEFIGIQETRKMVSMIEKTHPDLVKEVAKMLNLQKLAEIFRRLINEEVSIKDMRSIFESIIEEAQNEKDTVILSELIRASLKRFLTYKYSAGEASIAVYLLSPELEDMVRSSVKETSSGTYLALDPDIVQNIIQATRRILPPFNIMSKVKPVILTTVDIRRFIYKLLISDFPGIAVLSYQEILPAIHIQPIGKITL